MPISRTKQDLPGAKGLILADAAPSVEAGAEASADPGLEPTDKKPPATDEPGQASKAVAGTAPRTASGGHPFRHHEIPLGDGKLVLDREGSIRNVAADGSVTATWQPDDPDWSRHAIRFGLRPSAGGSPIPGHPPQRAKRPRI